jgi:hypothetical protein
MTTVHEVPLGDGDQLADLMEDDQPRIVVLTPGLLPDRSYGYRHRPYVIPTGVGKYLTTPNGVGQAHTWCNANGEDYAVQVNGQEGGAGARSVGIQNVTMRTNALRAWHLVNSQDNRYRNMLGVGAAESIVLENRGPDGFSEQNTLDRCGGQEAHWCPLSFHRGSGRASFRATTVTHYKGHLNQSAANADGVPPVMLYMGLGSHVYDSELSVFGWMDDKENGSPSRPWLNQYGAKLLGDQKGTKLNLRLENGGLFLAELNGHHSAEMAELNVAGSWPYQYGIVVDLAANTTLEESLPQQWTVTGAVLQDTLGV